MKWLIPSVLAGFAIATAAVVAIDKLSPPSIGRNQRAAAPTPCRVPEEYIRGYWAQVHGHGRSNAAIEADIKGLAEGYCRLASNGWPPVYQIPPDLLKPQGR